MNRIFQVFSLAALILSLAKPAHAYIDPASGAMVWQFLMAVVFGALFYIKSIWRYSKEKLSRLKSFLR